jgi:hypothetical protein
MLVGALISFGSDGENKEYVNLCSLHKYSVLSSLLNMYLRMHNVYSTNIACVDVRQYENIKHSENITK